ncbi:MAG: cysteine-rich CWC family protein [Sulfuritalea sp.]|nr:cysteine-rich CWC family protein [Sulfuritalea sp.]
MTHANVSAVAAHPRVNQVVDVSASLLPTNVCPQCGAQFRCGMEAGDTECWCVKLPAIVPLPAKAETGASGAASCFCPVCLKARLK